MHLIVGLGENEREIAEPIQSCTDRGIHAILFAYTPIPGTALENISQPPTDVYRRVQIVRNLVVNRSTRFQSMQSDGKGRIVDFGVSESQLREVIAAGTPFPTSGCPECNRPYYK